MGDMAAGGKSMIGSDVEGVGDPAEFRLGIAGGGENVHWVGGSKAVSEGWLRRSAAWGWVLVGSSEKGRSLLGWRQEVSEGAELSDWCADTGCRGWVVNRWEAWGSQACRVFWVEHRYQKSAGDSGDM